MARRKLTELEKRFVDEYLTDLNGVQAHRRAFGPGTSYAASAVEASKLLKKPNIREEIRAGQRAIQKMTRVSAAAVIRETRAYAFSDPINLFAEDGATPRNIREIPAETRRAIASIKVRRETDRRTKDGETEVRVTHEVIEYKLWPKPDALDKLYRHLGLDQPIPPLEALLAALPPDLAGQVRAALAAALPAGDRPAGGDERAG